MKMLRFNSSNHLLVCGALALALTLAFGGTRLSAQALSAQDAAALPPTETDGATTNATGSGTANHLARWTGATALGNSIITQINGKIGIGNATPPSLLTVDGKDPAAATIRGTNTSSGKGVAGTSVSGTGVAGTSTSGVAVQGNVTGANNANAAIKGQTSSTAPKASGVTGEVTSTSAGDNSTGVRGINNSTGGLGVGVLGEGNIGVSGSGSSQGVFGAGPTGVYGSGLNYGVYGKADGDGNTLCYGVYGVRLASKGGGVYGIAPSATGVIGVGVIGVEGDTNAGAGVSGNSNTGTGVAGYSNTGAGVTGQSSDHFGVYGISTNSYAGYFDGNVHVNGTLSKSAGSFEIDHPLDPEHKNLSHSFVESPDMMNIYNGNAELDEHGEATVQMPDYFTALNQDYRYQLTAMGAPGPNLYVADEIKENRFKIAGGKPGTRISWQVTGVRHDAYANAHRIAVESPKSPAQIGHYLNPELFGRPADSAINMAAHAASGKVAEALAVK